MIGMRNCLDDLADKTHLLAEDVGAAFRFAL